MRQGPNNPNNRRGRGRGHHHNNKRHNNNRNQTFDSNGPLGRVRGNAKQLCEKYLQQAKDAISSGDRILAESLYQHADHYGRIAAQFAPKPRPDEEDDSAQEDSQDNASEVKTVEIEDADSASDEGVQTTSSDAEEEPPKRRTRKTTPVKRAPRKKSEDDDQPKLGGSDQAVPDFLARPVDLEDGSSKGESADLFAEDEKPKRRTRKPAAPRKTTTRRKKADEADSDSDAEAANA